jgi:hypothetical protein
MATKTAASRSTVAQIDAKIDTHIDTCAVRYEGIETEMRGVNARLKRLEGILISATGAILLLLISLILKVV